MRALPPALAMAPRGKRTGGQKGRRGVKREPCVKLEKGSMTPQKVKQEMVEDTPEAQESKAKMAEQRSKGATAFQKLYVKANWAKRLVFRGSKSKTSSGLRKRDLMMNARGRVVSKKVSAKSKRLYRQNHLDLWTQVTKEVREERGFTGFVMQKKFGTQAQRRIYLEIHNRWLDAIAARVVSTMQGRPEIVERIMKFSQEAEDEEK